MVKEMVATDLDIFRREKILKEAGYEVMRQHE
jgi:hypothetical protein